MTPKVDKATAPRSPRAKCPKTLRRGIGLAKLREISSNKVPIFFSFSVVTSSASANGSSVPTTTHIVITTNSSTEVSTLMAGHLAHVTIHQRPTALVAPLRRLNSVPRPVQPPPVPSPHRQVILPVTTGRNGLAVLFRWQPQTGHRKSSVFAQSSLGRKSIHVAEAALRLKIIGSSTPVLYGASGLNNVRRMCVLGL
jgi:hypothetical protein